MTSSATAKTASLQVRLLAGDAHSEAPSRLTAENFSTWLYGSPAKNGYAPERISPRIFIDDFEIAQFFKKRFRGTNALNVSSASFHK